ncbi:MAG: hypothetical protein IK120_09350 [Muribaculaceae bacterium]|nr:hypothetical protein [Muribaculaceae bacterium]
MKLLKIFIVAIFVAIALPTLVSCGGDEPDGGNKETTIDKDNPYTKVPQSIDNGDE